MSFQISFRAQDFQTWIKQDKLYEAILFSFLVGLYFLKQALEHLLK